MCALNISRTVLLPQNHITSYDELYSQSYPSSSWITFQHFPQIKPCVPMSPCLCSCVPMSCKNWICVSSIGKKSYVSLVRPARPYTRQCLLVRTSHVHALKLVKWVLQRVGTEHWPGNSNSHATNQQIPMANAVCAKKKRQLVKFGCFWKNRWLSGGIDCCWSQLSWTGPFYRRAHPFGRLKSSLG